jgi:hypothetical protein
MLYLYLLSKHLTISRKMIKSTSEKVKRGKLMTNIKLHSMNYTVGPLDFVGVADVITVGLKQ